MQTENRELQGRLMYHALQSGGESSNGRDYEPAASMIDQDPDRAHDSLRAEVCVHADLHMSYLHFIE